MKRDLLLHTAMAFLQGFPMLNCGDEIAQLNGWDYKNDPDRVEDSRNLHRSKFNWEDAKQRTRKGTLQNQLWQGMEQLRQMRADPCFAPDAWVTTWDSHNPGVLALVRKRGEETLVGLFNFTEYPAGGKSGRSGWRVPHPGRHFRLAGGCGAGTVSVTAGKKQISKTSHPALSFRQSFQSIFSQSAENGVFSKVRVCEA